MAPPPYPSRLQPLDATRGVAVLGIVAANIVGFALPAAAYYSPVATGPASGADLATWVATFVLVEGRMRALFSILFGASLLLVAERAASGGDDPATAHLARMGWLFAIGLAHLYLVWWGDILAHYALVGLLAWPFGRWRVRWLLLAAVALLLVHAAVLLDLARHATAAGLGSPQWLAFADAFGAPATGSLAAETAALGGTWPEQVAWRWQHAPTPIEALWSGGAETLAYMLLGMAGLKTGFLAGTWARRRYLLAAAALLGSTLPLYGLLAWRTWTRGFAPLDVFAASQLWSVPLRPLGALGYAALAATLAGRSSLLTAAGRVALSNYLGASLVCTAIFYGGDQFARWSRASLAMLVLALWALMLAWPQPWLARFRHGPFEWVWRSLARFAWQPLRR
jgi:uncharacterized protein